MENNLQNSGDDKFLEERRNMQLAIIFLLGFLLGMVIKTEASYRITIGYGDYKIRTDKNIYRLSELERIQKKENQSSGESQTQTEDKSGKEVK